VTHLAPFKYLALDEGSLSCSSPGVGFSGLPGTSRLIQCPTIYVSQPEAVTEVIEKEVRSLAR